MVFGIWILGFEFRLEFGFRYWDLEFNFILLQPENSSNLKSKKAMSTKVNIFAGRASKSLVEKICAVYGKKPGTVDVAEFSDGEFQPSFEDNIRGDDVFIVQSTFAPAENILELLMMIDAAKRASASKIIAVIPYFGYARQDRKDKPRVSIASKLHANLLSAAGVSRLITIDLHADQIQGFFDVPVDHLYASSIFIPYIKQINLPNLVIASPDTGGTRRANAYAKILHTEMVTCYKQRIGPNVIGDMVLLGDVEGKDVVLVDDIIDTGGTIIKAAKLMVDNGATSVRAFATHAVLSGKAYEKIKNSVFDEVVLTDTIPLKQECEKITVLTAANLLADVIRRVHKNKSISSLYQFEHDSV